MALVRRRTTRVEWLTAWSSREMASLNLPGIDVFSEAERTKRPFRPESVFTFQRARSLVSVCVCGGEVENRLPYIPHDQGAVLYARRYERREAFCDNALLIVDCEFYLGAQILDILLIEPEKA